MTRIEIEKRLAARARNLAPSPIRELFPYMSLEGMISFGGGYPNPGTFPLARGEFTFKDGSCLTLDGASLEAASQYGPSDVHPALKSHLLAWHRAKDGIDLVADSLVTLNGAQEGLFIMAYLFLEKEDCVVVSEPTYPGALAAFRTCTDNFISIPLDEKGMDTAGLSQVLDDMAARGERLPKFIYTIPNGHNPGGVSLATERRRELIAAATRHDLLVLDDDPYQMIRLESGVAPPTLQQLDEDGRVIRLDSFSKIFAPGLRIGYASADPEVVRRFVLFKQAANLHTGSLAQALLAGFLERGGSNGLMEHIRTNCRFYRANRDVMLAAAAEFLPEGTGYNAPPAGFFVWFRMPEKCSATRMIHRDCESLKVLLVPGPGFSAEGRLDNCMRASFATASTDDIREGMKRFGDMVRREMEAE